jgi:hypothetical protein
VQIRTAYTFLAAKHLTGNEATNTFRGGINIPAMFLERSKLPHRIATVRPRPFDTRFEVLRVGYGPTLK